MELTEAFVFIAALLVFLLAAKTRNKIHLYVGATLLLFVFILPLTDHQQPPATIAAEERSTESSIIAQAAVLDRQAHAIIDNPPRTKSDSTDARDPNGTAAHFETAASNWLTRAEHGKPLDSFVDHNASTAAIRIVAAGSFLTSAVEAAVENCNDHDSHLNMAMADRIITDAKNSLADRGDPHFPTPDLSRQLDDSNNCIDEAP